MSAAQAPCKITAGTLRTNHHSLAKIAAEEPVMAILPGIGAFESRARSPSKYGLRIRYSRFLGKPRIPWSGDDVLPLLGRERARARKASEAHARRTLYRRKAAPSDALVRTHRPRRWRLPEDGGVRRHPHASDRSQIRMSRWKLWKSRLTILDMLTSFSATGSSRPLRPPERGNWNPPSCPCCLEISRLTRSNAARFEHARS